MKNPHLAFTLAFSFLVAQSVFAQGPNLLFNLRYNLTLNRYEVYALPDATQTVFNWGPSQISIVAPAVVPNQAFQVTFVAGGAWIDNSQVYAPAVDPTHDYHGVGSLGATTTFTENVEKLIFHFLIPSSGCIPGLRLYINGQDPTSADPGMNGGDFSNTVFAIIPGLPNGYEAYAGNYNNTGTLCVATPLELVLFRAEQSDDAIHLIWNTEKETDFSHFELERSQDAIHFKTIARVESDKTLALKGAYSHNDRDVLAGIVYLYRLKMVDLNGHFAYSNLVQAITSKEVSGQSRVSPNPSFGQSTLSVVAVEEMEASLSILNAAGFLLESKKIQLDKGLNEYPIDLQNYPCGFYQIVAGNAQILVTQKIIKVN